MQYVHRKLHRSVTEMRRSRITLPNRSVRSTCPISSAYERNRDLPRPERETMDTYE
jgi:hypothetical protein